MWQLRPGQNLRHRQFDDEFVLFNDLSGDTHLLGGSAMQLLGELQAGPRGSGELLAALAGALGCARDAAFDLEAGAVLAQLATLALIQAA